jgi:biopolymer transport protein TolR
MTTKDEQAWHDFRHTVRVRIASARAKGEYANAARTRFRKTLLQIAFDLTLGILVVTVAFFTISSIFYEAVVIAQLKEEIQQLRKPSGEDRPKIADNTQPNTKESVSITIDQSGKVFVQETEVKLEEIASKLKAIVKNGRDQQILIRGDKASDYGLVMGVMERVRAAGFTKVSLVTEPEGGATGSLTTWGLIGSP